MKRLFLPLALALVLPQARAQDKPTRPDLDAKTIASTFSTDWYGVYLGEKKIGYFMGKRENADKGKVRDSFVMSMKLVSFGKKTELVISQDMFYEGEAPYRLLRGEYNQVTDGVKVHNTLERGDKGFVHTLSAAGMDIKKDLPDIDYNLADAMASELWLRTAPKDGASITARDFNMEDMKVETQTNTLLDRKTSLVAGVSVTYFSVESISTRQKLKMKTLHDEQGRLLSGNISVFELRRETEEQAKNTEFTADLFVLGQVKVDRPLGRTDRLEELVLEVLGKGGELIPDGPRQSIEDKDGKRVVRLGKKFGKSVKATEKEIKEALEETTALPITHPKVVAYAKQAVGDADTPAEKVKRLVDFTYRFIEPKLTASPPEIHHLLERKSGDCKCYARLFCVLARANGLPVREVAGFVYMGDDAKAFGGHVWDEVLLDGIWVPVDASMNRTEVTAGHIYLGSERDSGGILDTVGKMRFRVVDFKTK